MLHVFGHLNPDTDSVCSAIAYSWFLNEVENLPSTPYVLGSLNKETAYVLSKFSQAVPELLQEVTHGTEYVLVDTNNPEELLASHSAGILKEIIDHHKLISGLATSEPISVTMRPVACTATIIWQKMLAKQIQPPAHIAGLMLAAIVSDTLKFTSPTTTKEDSEAAKQLAPIAEVDVDDLAGGMFEAKSDLSGMAASDLLVSDSKVFNLGGKKIRVSSLETTKPNNALAMREELLNAMEEMKKEEGLDGLFFFIVDILESSARLLVPSDFETKIAEQGFERSFEDGILTLPGVVSRKKQILPALEKALVA